MRWWIVLLLVGPSASWAGTQIQMDSMSVNGLEVRHFQCDLQSGGFFAGAGAVASLAKQKEAFDTCQATGGAFHVSWTWSGGRTTNSTVVASSASSQNTCVQAALSKVASELVGSCSAIVLTGPQKAAESAMATLPCASTNTCPSAK